MLIESLSPGEVNFTAEDILSAEHFKNGAKQAQLQSFDKYLKYGMLNALLYQKKLGDWNYLNFIDIASAIMKLVENPGYFYDDYSEIHNPNGTHCYGYTFNTDKHGKVIVDSMHITMIMSALKEIEKNKNANIEEKFNDSVEKFVQGKK